MLERMLPHIVPGLIYGIGSLGLALSFRYLRFPDFTALGSIMLGGIICVSVTNLTNSIFGILGGLFIGSLLGLATGWLVHRLRIQPVLAGIITFTGSASIGYLLATQGGSIGLTHGSILSPTFSFKDVIGITVFAIVVCAFISFLIKTKFGSLLLAMTADRHFLRLRHRSQGKVFTITLVIGNAIVGLAGALYALKEHAAQVQSHVDFLPYSLGAIFGGNAVTMWVSRTLTKGNLRNPAEETHKTNYKRLLYTLGNIMSTERDDSSRIGVLFFVYVLGCLFFKEVSGLVLSNAFTTINPSFTVPPNFQYLVIAFLIAFFVWWAGWEED